MIVVKWEWVIIEFLLKSVDNRIKHWMKENGGFIIEISISWQIPLNLPWNVHFPEVQNKIYLNPDFEFQTQMILNNKKICTEPNIYHKNWAHLVHELSTLFKSVSQI